MSNRYKGGIISATPPTTTGGNDGVASGAWTLEQQMQAQAAGLWPNQPVFYIEDVFSTWLYTGNGTSQSINNGIDLAGKGGLVWTKSRSSAFWHEQTDTVRGASKYISSNSTIAQQNSQPNHVTAFNSNGFSVGNESDVNANGATFASWTFREQPKFFDVVTYTGNGSSSQVIAHNLTSPPGCIIIKATSTTADWVVYARYDEIDPTTPLYKDLRLNTTAASTQNVAIAGATSFTVGGLGDPVNTNGVTYVAYLFAHNAGGFGLTGTDNVISCGSFTTDGSGNASVNLGYEPQWVMIKKVSTGDEAASGHWWMQDNMRGYPVPAGNSQYLQANTADAETFVPGGGLTFPTSTGFSFKQNYSGFNNATFIYIAIRRGPMRTPTTGTSVYNAIAYTKTNTTPRDITGAGFVPDLAHYKGRSGGANSGIDNNVFYDRLRGARSLVTNNFDAEAAGNQEGTMLQNGIVTSAAGEMNYETGTAILHFFGRAPGFFDEVCYTGNGVSGRTITHNLTTAPELLIVKRRAGGAANWNVGAAAGPGWGYAYILNSTGGASLTGEFTPAPTSSVFSVSGSGGVNASGSTYVAYLFATVAGVSKVGSYTGTGTTQTINCGFTGGARFVLIKRTDSTGDWYYWDTARGMIPANDPYLLLNSTAAEVTNTDFVDTAATGFEISSTAPAAINASGGTFIFLAIA